MQQTSEQVVLDYAATNRTAEASYRIRIKNLFS
jgi:hypothetical protein